MALEFRLASPTLALPPAKPSLRLATDVLQGGRDVQQANIPKRLQKDRQRPFQRLFEATQPICLSDAERQLRWNRMDQPPGAFGTLTRSYPLAPSYVRAIFRTWQRRA